MPFPLDEQCCCLSLCNVKNLVHPQSKVYIYPFHMPVIIACVAEIISWSLFDKGNLEEEKGN